VKDAVISRGYQILEVCHTYAKWAGNGEVKGSITV
jgi:hypothetical protein